MLVQYDYSFQHGAMYIAENVAYAINSYIQDNNISCVYKLEIA